MTFRESATVVAAQAGHQHRPSERFEPGRLAEQRAARRGGDERNGIQVDDQQRGPASRECLEALANLLGFRFLQLSEDHDEVEVAAPNDVHPEAAGGPYLDHVPGWGRAPEHGLGAIVLAPGRRGGRFERVGGPAMSDHIEATSRGDIARHNLPRSSPARKRGSCTVVADRPTGRCRCALSTRRRPHAVVAARRDARRQWSSVSAVRRPGDEPTANEDYVTRPAYRCS
jgi:hypothetical protein